MSEKLISNIDSQNDALPGEPIDSLVNILPSDWAGPQYPSLVANAIFLAHAGMTESSLTIKYEAWRFIIKFLDRIIYVGLIILIYMTWDNQNPSFKLPLLVKCVFDMVAFLMVPNFMRAAKKYTFKLIIPLLIISGIMFFLASQETGLAREYLIEISVGLFFLISVNFFANDYLDKLLKEDIAHIGFNSIKILICWLGITAIIIVTQLTDENFEKEYLMEIGFGLIIGFMTPFFSSLVKRGKIFIWITAILSFVIAIVGYRQSGLLQAFLYELSLTLILFIGLDYTFRNAKKKVKLKKRVAHKKLHDFDHTRSETELEEAERKTGNPLYYERPPDDYEEGKPYY